MTDNTHDDDEQTRFNHDARLFSAEILRVIRTLNPPPDILTSGVCVIAATVVLANGQSRKVFLDYCAEAWDAVTATIEAYKAKEAGQP